MCGTSPLGKCLITHYLSGAPKRVSSIVWLFFLFHNYIRIRIVFYTVKYKCRVWHFPTGEVSDHTLPFGCAKKGQFHRLALFFYFIYYIRIRIVFYTVKYKCRVWHFPTGEVSDHTLPFGCAKKGQFHRLALFFIS